MCTYRKHQYVPPVTHSMKVKAANQLVLEQKNLDLLQRPWLTEVNTRFPWLIISTNGKCVCIEIFSFCYSLILYQELLDVQAILTLKCLVCMCVCMNIYLSSPRTDNQEKRKKRLKKPEKN